MEIDIKIWDIDTRIKEEYNNVNIKTKIFLIIVLKTESLEKN
jgi:hypothetical protein